MLLSVLYLSWNLAVIVLLLRLKYHRSWRFLCAMLAANCWQIGVILAVPLQEGHIPVAIRRTLAIHWWLPGEVLLLGLTIAAIGEALWRAMAGIPARHKVGVSLSLAGALTATGLAAEYFLGIPKFGDWYRQAIADRLIVNLCMAAAALIAFGLAETFHRRHDPRFVRMHCGILATLASGHVILSDMAQWQHHNALYRALEAACLFGWIVNADLLRREAAAIDASTPVVRSTPRSPALPPPLPRVEPHPSHSGVRAAQVVPANPYRRAVWSEPSWPERQPDAHAGM